MSPLPLPNRTQFFCITHFQPKLCYIRSIILPPNWLLPHPLYSWDSSSLSLLLKFYLSLLLVLDIFSFQSLCHLNSPCPVLFLPLSSLLFLGSALTLGSAFLILDHSYFLVFFFPPHPSFGSVLLSGNPGKSLTDKEEHKRSLKKNKCHDKQEQFKFLEEFKFLYLELFSVHIEKIRANQVTMLPLAYCSLFVINVTLDTMTRWTLRSSPCQNFMVGRVLRCNILKSRIVYNCLF